jgi:HSP90 family molecular chaperone
MCLRADEVQFPCAKRRSSQARRLASGSTERPQLPKNRGIELATDARSGTLSIEDNGAGLTVEEIHRYLATVGAGYTRTLRDQDASSSLIGYFGLGFLSAFVVSEKTDVWTCSYQDGESKTAIYAFIGLPT